MYGLQPKHGVFGAHPTVNDELPNRMACGRAFLFRMCTHSGTVLIKPQIARFTGAHSLAFVDGTTVRHGAHIVRTAAQVDDIDSVIVCTGYSFGFDVLERGKLIRVDDNRVRLYLNMYAPYIAHAHTLAIIGLVQPLGSIMPIAEMQAGASARTVHDVCAGASLLQCADGRDPIGGHGRNERQH